MPKSQKDANAAMMTGNPLTRRESTALTVDDAAAGTPVVPVVEEVGRASGQSTLLPAEVVGVKS